MARFKFGISFILRPVYDTLTGNSGDKTKIRNVSYVEREGPWRIFYQDAKNHWLHGNVDGDMTKSSGSVVMCGRGKEKKATTRHRYILKFIVKK